MLHCCLGNRNRAAGVPMVARGRFQHGRPLSNSTQGTQSTIPAPLSLFSSLPFSFPASTYPSPFIKSPLCAIPRHLLYVLPVSLRLAISLMLICFVTLSLFMSLIFFVSSLSLYLSISVFSFPSTISAPFFSGIKRLRLSCMS